MSYVGRVKKFSQQTPAQKRFQKGLAGTVNHFITFDKKKKR